MVQLDPLPGGDVLTTGQAARLCGVHFRTVLRWIERGLLQAYQLPGTRADRRIPVAELRRFMRENNIPDPWNALTVAWRALIVDDDSAMAHAIERVLHNAGFETCVAASGFEAGTLLHTFKPGLMTLDLRMPGVDGIDVLCSLKKTALPVPLKIVVVSADTEERLREALQLGAHAVLKKPFANTDLLEIVNRLCSDVQSS